MIFEITSGRLFTPFSSASSKSFVCHSPKLSRAVIFGRLSPITAGDTSSASSLPVSDMISAGCSLFPDRSVTSGDICAAVYLSFSISVNFWRVNLGKGGCSTNSSPLLEGLVVIAIAQAVGGTLLSQSVESLEIKTLVDYLFILLWKNLTHSAIVKPQLPLVRLYTLLGILLSLSHQTSCLTGHKISPCLSYVILSKPAAELKHGFLKDAQPRSLDGVYFQPQTIW